jgi:hypothetical protein
MLNRCLEFAEKYRDDVFFSDESPNKIGIWDPSILPIQKKFVRWARRHEAKCDDCFGVRLNMLLSGRNLIVNRFI